MIWKVIINYLHLLYKEVKGILLYQWFPSPILPTKHQDRREVCFVGNIILLNVIILMVKLVAASNLIIYFNFVLNTFNCPGEKMYMASSFVKIVRSVS